jgi:hypothetical protein
MAVKSKLCLVYRGRLTLCMYVQYIGSTFIIGLPYLYVSSTVRCGGGGGGAGSIVCYVVAHNINSSVRVCGGVSIKPTPLPEPHTSPHHTHTCSIITTF